MVDNITIFQFMKMINDKRETIIQNEILEAHLLGSQLKRYSVIRLKRMCKERGIGGYSNKSKKVLIKLLQDLC